MNQPQPKKYTYSSCDTSNMLLFYLSCKFGERDLFISNIYAANIRIPREKEGI